MDNILPNHTPELLESTFDSVYLYDHPLYSLLAEKTRMPWLLIIPKQALNPTDNLNYVQRLYGEIYRLIGFMQTHHLGGHFNLAKIGNKNPNQHIHLIFREEGDEVWPDAVWCREPLSASEQTPVDIKAALAPFFTA
jgi:diadenosine tetraphosphate (Ap4A) HIT family hydrolase